jgi:hypothetical protein
MGKRPNWSMSFEDYIPLNYSHKYSDLIKDLGLSSKDETYRLMSQETADEIANRVNKMLEEKGIEQKARTFQVGDYRGIELPNFKLTRDYQNGGKITNTMKKKKTKTLPLDNNLPKAFLGAMLNKWNLPTGAAAGGGGDGANSLSNMNNSSLSTAGGPLGGVMKMLNGPLAPLMGMATNAVTDMAHAINTPERERRPVLQNAASYTFDNGGLVGNYMDAFDAMAYGGTIDPSMYMQQLMYGSYAQGGQVPQNIPVEVEGQEMYEMPNGQMGEFEGPSHENGGIPVALPEGTKVYSDRLKVNGKTMAVRKDKREANIAKLEKLLGKSPHDKFLRQSLERQKETAALEEQSDMAMQEQANQQQVQQEQAMMQEQMMGQLMQDPAMMQQMGMMMYGGKLANGTPPYGLNNPFTPEYAAPQTGAYPQMTDANYAQMLDEKDYEHSLKYLPYSNRELNHDMKSGYAKNPSYIYRNSYDNDLKDMQWSYFDPKGKKTNWTNILKTDPLYNELDVTRKKLNRVSRQYGNNEHENDLFGLPLTFPRVTPEPMNVARLQPTGLNSIMALNPNEKYLGNEDGFPVIGGKDDEMLVKGAKPEPPGVNPYDVMNNMVGNTFGNISRSKDPYINTKGGLIPNPFYNEVIGNKMLPEEGPKKPNKFMNFLNNAVDQTGDFFSGLFDKNGKPKKEKSTKENKTKSGENLDYTRGDLMGMAGTLFGGLAPMTTTMMNRMMTPKNTNFFSTFGQNALRTQEEAEGLAGISKDEAYRKNLMRANALRKQLANSARGVGDIRSGQLTAELAEQEGARGILTNYLQGMSGLKGQRAQLQQQIDQTRMGGEQQRDLADRQDVDQFYTNLAENVANASNMMQKQGRDLNVVQYNKDVLALSKAYSKYGVYAVRNPKTGVYDLAQKDANGNVVYLTEDEVRNLPKKNEPQIKTTEVKELK